MHQCISHRNSANGVVSEFGTFVKKRLKVFDLDVPELVPRTNDVSADSAKHDEATLCLRCMANPMDRPGVALIPNSTHRESQRRRTDWQRLRREVAMVSCSSEPSYCTGHRIELRRLRSVQETPTVLGT